MELLGDELLVCVFRFLDWKSLNRAKLVCLWWNIIACDPLVFRRMSLCLLFSLLSTSSPSDSHLPSCCSSEQTYEGRYPSPGDVAWISLTSAIRIFKYGYSLIHYSPIGTGKTALQRKGLLDEFLSTQYYFVESLKTLMNVRSPSWQQALSMSRRPTLPASAAPLIVRRITENVHSALLMLMPCKATFQNSL